MKKFLLGTVLLLVLASGGGLYYIYSHLDRLVQQAIELAGSEALGSEVTVERVELDLGAGRASVHGLAIANPEGFSDNTLFSFREATVVLDLASLSPQHIGIRSIAAANPRVYFERRDGASNIDALRQRLATSDDPAETPVTEDSAAPLQLRIDSVVIEQIEAVLDVRGLPAPVQTSLGDVRLQDLAGTPDEVARQIADPLLRQIASQAATNLLKVSAGTLRDSAAEIGRSALDKAGAAGEQLREGFNNLLQRN